MRIDRGFQSLSTASCRPVKTIGHRMAYEEAARSGIPPDVLNYTNVYLPAKALIQFTSPRRIQSEMWRSR